MFKDLLNQAKQLLGLAKEAKMQTIDFNHVEQRTLSRVLAEIDQLNIAIGHATYMTNYFEQQYRSAGVIQDCTNNHQAMLLSRRHLLELTTRRDEIQGQLDYLKHST